MEATWIHRCYLSRLPTITNPHPRPISTSPSPSPSLQLHNPCILLHKFHHRSAMLLPLRASSSSLSFHFEDLKSSISLTNDDLKPTTPDQRTFSALDFGSLWVGLVVGVPTYYLAGSLVELGMVWWQGIATVVLANVILIVPLILTGHAGTCYGISFPVLARAAFGIRGAHLPTLLRALVGCGWFGIETWIGGQTVFLLLPLSFRQSPYAQTLPWLGTSLLEFACFLTFWAAQMGIIWKEMEGIRDLEKYSAPILVFLTGALLCWAYFTAGGFGTMLSTPSSLTTSQFWALFFPSLTANISFWATLAINIPDFTRYAKSQADQVLGQVAIPVFMGAFTFVGLAVTSSTQVIFGHVISSPIELLARISGNFAPALILSIVGISLATLTTNIAANVVAPANALVNLSPSIFTFQRGALLTALLGILAQPWRLLASSESFIYTWLIGYSALLGPIGGIVLVDYYLLRHTNLDLRALYSDDPIGPYWYGRGYNWAAVAALVMGILPVMPGFLNKLGILKSTATAFVTIYNNAWFIGFSVSGVIYWLLSQSSRSKSSQSAVDSPPMFG
ncbi:hypothetical protein AMTRI_Chr04g184490 [Amborella trichopoda]